MDVLITILIALGFIIFGIAYTIKYIKKRGIKGYMRDLKESYNNIQKSQQEFKELYNKTFPKKKYEFKCPKCGSKDIYTYKRGFKTGRFILGSMFLGALDGTMLGLIGKDKIKHKCLCCGKEWNSK